MKIILVKSNLTPTKSVLILSGLDVDSLCALRSLILLLQNDYIPYTLKPIKSKSHLFKTIGEHKVSFEIIAHIILLIGHEKLGKFYYRFKLKN